MLAAGTPVGAAGAAGAAAGAAGEAGAAALLANPNANVIDVLSRFKSKNYNPVAVVTQNGGNVKMTAGQFASLWINKGNALQEVYRRRLGRA